MIDKILEIESLVNENLSLMEIANEAAQALESARFAVILKVMIEKQIQLQNIVANIIE